MLGSRTSDGRATRIGGVRWIAAACGAALALGAYGVGTTAAFAKTAKPTVAFATVGGVGKVLVDAQGRTLYTFTNDGRAVPCTGECAALWPPLTVKSTFYTDENIDQYKPAAERSYTLDTIPLVGG